MKMIKTILALVIVIILAAIAFAEPYGPTAISRDRDERGNVSAGTSEQEVQAQAGNVTQLSINTTKITNNWQGYYGNISGSITLDDASGNTMYDWSADDFSVIGEIYAANQSIADWNDVICVNLAGTGINGVSGINVTRLEDMYGIQPSEVDGLDETFLGTEDIIIGTNTLSACPSTHTYQSDSPQSNYWNETLITENATGTVIFASKVDDNTVGFDGNTWDFQMLVAEDGGTAGSTSYWFYVELV